jgi:putative alpha-1,2-mannosidase
VQKEAYRTGAFGFCGNEDVGQLSAWFVLSAIGLAQICPSEKTFQLNTPLFKSATVKLDSKYHPCKNSNLLKIECDKDPIEYPYIDKILLNGTEIKGHSVSYDDLTNGANLTFILRKDSK